MTVAPAVVRRAQVRPPLHHPTRDAHARLRGVEALVLAPAARVLRNAAGLHDLVGMPCAVPVGGPLPHVADHAAEAVAVYWEGLDGRGALEPVFEEVLPGKLTLPGVRHVPAARSELRTPAVLGAVEPATRGMLPLGLGRQDLAGPARVRLDVGEGDVHH